MVGAAGDAVPRPLLSPPSPRDPRTVRAYRVQLQLDVLRGAQNMTYHPCLAPISMIPADTRTEFVAWLGM